MDSSGHVDVGPLTVFFPSGSMRSFWFLHDLAGLFGVEFNADAEKRLRSALRDRSKGRLSIEHEADAVMVHASNAHLMRVVLEALRDLSVDKSAWTTEAIESAHAAMLAAPKPKRQRWEVGSLFAVPLADGTWAFGQVVASPGPKLGATLALFEARRRAPEIEAGGVEEIVTSPTLTILHTTAADLDDGLFRVLDVAPVLVDPDKGPQGPRSAGRSWDGIATIANAWFGLHPWNFFADEDFLDRKLMPGLRRPANAWLLSAAELAGLRSLEKYGPKLEKMIADRLRVR